MLAAVAVQHGRLHAPGRRERRLEAGAARGGRRGLLAAPLLLRGHHGGLLRLLRLLRLLPLV